MEKVMIVGNLVLAVVVAFWLCSCSFQVGMDWNGETAVDKRTFTDKNKK